MAAQRDEARGPEGRVGGEIAGWRYVDVAVEVGEADVAEHDVRAKLACERDARPPVPRDAHLVPRELEDLGEGLPGVHVVLDAKRGSTRTSPSRPTWTS